jgi:predicted metal-dependent RNase
MDDNNIEKLIMNSLEMKSAPDYLWSRIKEDIARDIAKELLEKLEKQKEPKKQESMDRTNAIILMIAPERFLKGA